jgi:hypothetical protein
VRGDAEYVCLSLEASHDGDGDVCAVLWGKSKRGREAP